MATLGGDPLTVTDTMEWGGKLAGGPRLPALNVGAGAGEDNEAGDGVCTPEVELF
jgi:hypothetical protein